MRTLPMGVQATNAEALKLIKGLRTSRSKTSRAKPSYTRRLGPYLGAVVAVRAPDLVVGTAGGWAASWGEASTSRRPLGY